MGCFWVAIILAMAAIWNASSQLGLATWWLGPRGDRMPIIVNLLPFVGPVAMIVAILNNVRYLPWCGVIAAAPIVVLAIVDLGRVPSVARFELGIGVAAALGTVLSMLGTYRATRPVESTGR